MSSGFVTETEIAEQRRLRQAEWEKVRTADQPLEAPEETYDPRPLYQRLEEQKQKKDAEYEEAHKLKNMIRGLDDDEVGFLDLVERSKATAARQISLEEQREMEEFRQRVSNLSESEEDKRLALQLSGPTTKKTPSNNSTRAKLQGVIVRKRKASDDEQMPTKNGRTGLDTKEEIKKEKDQDAENAQSAGDIKCVCVLPGLGHYDDDTTDSDNSSDSDECPVNKKYDLCGRLQEIHDKKKEEKS